MAANVNNYIAAGNAAVKNSYAALAAARDNSPKYDEIAKAGMRARAEQKISAMKADADVKETQTKANTYLKKHEIAADRDASLAKSKKKTQFAGKIAAAGAVMAASLLPAAEIIKPGTLNFDKSEQRIRAGLDKANKDIADIKSKAPTTTPTKPDTASTTVATASPVRAPSSSSGKPSGSVRTWDQAYSLAQQTGAKFPELIAAQWQHESAHGTALAGSNNYFGMKATGGESSTNSATFEYSGGKAYNTNSNFMNFDTPESSFQTLADRWHSDYGNYTGVSSSSQTAAEAAVKLKQQGYATDPNYSNALIRIMQERGY